MDDKLELFLSGQQFKKFQEAYLAEILEKYDLNLIDVRVLLFLHEHGSVGYDTAKDIVEMHSLAKSYVSKSVDKLIGHGFLERRNLGRDRRFVHLLVREEAFPLLEQIQEQRKKMVEQMFRGIGREQLDTFREVAGKISGNIMAVR